MSDIVTLQRLMPSPIGFERGLSVWPDAAQHGQSCCSATVVIWPDAAQHGQSCCCATCCSATCCSTTVVILPDAAQHGQSCCNCNVLQCSVLQCNRGHMAGCCSARAIMLQCNVLQCSVLQCNVLQCNRGHIAGCCSARAMTRPSALKHSVAAPRPNRAGRATIGLGLRVEGLGFREGLGGRTVAGVSSGPCGSSDHVCPTLCAATAWPLGFRFRD